MFVAVHTVSLLVLVEIQQLALVGVAASRLFKGVLPFYGTIHSSISQEAVRQHENTRITRVRPHVPVPTRPGPCIWTLNGPVWMDPKRTPNDHLKNAVPTVKQGIM